MNLFLLCVCVSAQKKLGKLLPSSADGGVIVMVMPLEFEHSLLLSSVSSPN